jgi:hypothetical protein
MRLIRKWTAAVLVLLHSFVAHGSQASLETPITQERLRGRWEAVLPEEGRVFVVVVTDNRTTAATALARPGGRVDDIRFAITDTNVTKGRIRWLGSATSESDNYRVKIEGTGTEVGGSGRIEARWILMNPAGRKVLEWRVLMIGREESYLGRLAQAANLLLGRLKE